MGHSRLCWLSLVVVLAGTLLVPLGLRGVNVLIRNPDAAPSFIPSVESPRVREPFDAEVVRTLTESRPDYFVIGDSMAGTRIAPGHLSRLVGGHGLAALLHPGTGSAYWYLAFKNWIVNAGLRPRTVIFFFRDENLTEPLFRVYPGSLDRVARAQEPVLNEILAARMNGTYVAAHDAARRVYQFDRTRAWLEPVLLRAPVAWSARRSARKKLLDTINNNVFTLEALRPMAAADMLAAGDDALDFDRSLPTSVLPEIIRISKQSGVRVAFVRVQRRPSGTRPPVQSEALQRYVAKLGAYLAANGALFRDDWGDPDQPERIYEDGDHIAREYQRHYTELFFRKNPEFFR